jgi:ABC-type branched-subunit amino acid transport system substrate-binding protein
VKALKENGGKAPTRAEVLKNVQATNLETPIGKVGFDANGDTTAPILSLYSIKDGKAVFENQINLAGK